MSASAKPKTQRPKKPIRLADILFVLEMEANDIRRYEDFYARHKELRVKVSAKELERAEVFEAAIRLLERIRPVFGAVIELAKKAEAEAATNIERGGRDGGKRQGAV